MLTKWLNGIKAEDFFEGYWGSESFLYQLNEEMRVPFTVEKFESILFSGQLHYPQLKVFDDGGVVDLRLFTESNSKEIKAKVSEEKLVKNGLLTGKTLVLNNLQTLDVEMMAFANELQQMFGCKVNINAYFTNGPARGANAHYDLHHIFAVQLFGEKKWGIGSQIVESPNAEYTPQPHEDVSFEQSLVLKENEILYMPPGMWHTVETENVSLHLAIGLQPPNWYAYLQDLLRHAMKEHPILRSDLPFTIEQDRCNFQQDVGEELDILVDIIQTEIPSYLSKQQSSINPIQFLPKGQINGNPNCQFENKTITQALSDIWSIVSEPMSMYIRGSVTKPNRTHEPWDLDIIVIHTGTLKYTKDQIREYIHEKYQKIPTIDLTVIPLKEMNDEKWLMIRMLILQQSLHYYGEPIKEQLEKPVVTEKTLGFVKQHFQKTIYSKIDKLEKIGPTISEEERWTRTRTIAKSALRCIGVHTLKEQNELLRDPIECHTLIHEHFPELIKPSNTMLECIKGRTVPLDEFLQDARSLSKRLLQYDS
ncbi:JmjC domain-containing protein [Alkalihalobacterium alkalinitrilicum]|uniref:JmjC domain-containing protein n=1 Tax=Alkalihalobacterium alkalinitrilicum TaxID=427920 RepID=UPI000994C681|nr:cupin domain-containing protein [Alkalihalobacterium alkalinitrilicum]